MVKGEFFREQKEQSKIKTNILVKYFRAWAQIMKSNSTNPLAYIDLFSGPGYYDDGSQSTPIEILSLIINETNVDNEFIFRNRVMTLFNDVNRNFTESLKQSINSIKNIDTLRYYPQVFNEEIGINVIDQLRVLESGPKLFFIDPWGYKGLSLQLIGSTIKDWGCDCIFFFNYNRINMSLTNPSVKEHIDALFGVTRANKLRERIAEFSPKDKELSIVEEICDALQDVGGEYRLPFRFKDENQDRTSHYLIFVSKKFKGFEIMRDIMAKESSSNDEGVPSFEYSPASEIQPYLFSFTQPLQVLKDMLVTEFDRQTLTRDEIYQRHSPNRPYVKKNYTQAILELEAEGRCTITVRTKNRRQQGKLPKNAQITFEESDPSSQDQQLSLF
jgi:three-Cys-motif partner protein